MISDLRKLNKLFDKRDKLYYSGLFVLMLIGSLLEVAGIGAVPAFVATLATPEKLHNYPAVAKILDTLGITTIHQLVVWGAIGLIVIYTLKNAYMILLYYLKFRMTAHHRVRISHNLFSLYMKAPYEFHLGRNSSEILRNITLEVREIITGIINPILNLVLALLMTFFILVLLVLATPGVALVGIGIMGLGSWLFLRYFQKKMLLYGRKARDERKASIQAINQGLGAFQEARIFGREEHFISSFFTSVARYAKYAMTRQFAGSIGSPFLEFIAVTGLMIILLILASTGMDLKAMIPMLSLFGAAVIRLRATISSIIGNINQIRFSVPSIDIVVDDVKLLKELNKQYRTNTHLSTDRDDDDNTPSKTHLEKEILIDSVTYSYPNTKQPALQDISLKIPKGSSIAFVGSTGSGKTSLVNVILGLLVPQKGEVKVDGVSIHSNIAGWQKNIGYIPQNIYLLDDTIRHNIAFGLTENAIDDDLLWKAIRDAQLESFVNDLEEGVDSMVGERGVRISGGQRQRIGLARALYGNPQILIMDEATSSLDNQTENLVMQSIEQFRGERTIIMIAHRLSSVEKCDRLYFLKQGEIEADGSFTELKEFHKEFKLMADIT